MRPFHGVNRSALIRWVSGLVIAVACLLGSALRAATYTTTIPAAKGERYGSADYRIWIPDGVKTLRAVIVKQHGCGRTGLAHADDLQWQELARKWDSALLGTWLKPTGTNCADWTNPDFGSGRALLEALQRFSVTSKHAELENVPWALWGHSGGAFWSHAMAIRIPERVIGVFLQSGAVTVTNGPVTGIPMMLCRGTNDFTNIVQRVDTAFRMHRAMGAKWSVVVNPVTKHECGESRTLAIPFFDAVFNLRLPTPAPVDGNTTLIPITTEQVWLGSRETLEVGPSKQFKGDVNAACWFPSEAVARAWQEFSSTGLVLDKTAPRPPEHLRFSTAGGVEITWTAPADLQSGIHAFNIYRDGEKIATWRGDASQDEHQGFQRGNYGDEAEPAGPKMRYVDFTASKGRHLYEVTTLNWAALESEKSTAIEVRAK